jgi:hypothetical protein
MKGPDIHITPVERAGRIATGATGAMMFNSGGGGERR